MKRWLVCLPLVILMAFTLGCRPAVQAASPLSEEDVAAIRSLIGSYEEAVLAGNHDAAATVWAEDVIRMPPNAPMIEGRAAMLEEFGARAYVVKEFNQAFEEIAGRDGLAYARGPYSITITIPGNPEPVSDSGKSLAILRKQENGPWVITIACWNSDLPLPQEGSETWE